MASGFLPGEPAGEDAALTGAGVGCGVDTVAFRSVDFALSVTSSFWNMPVEPAAEVNRVVSVCRSAPAVTGECGASALVGAAETCVCVPEGVRVTGWSVDTGRFVNLVSLGSDAAVLSDGGMTGEDGPVMLWCAESVTGDAVPVAPFFGGSVEWLSVLCVNRESLTEVSEPLPEVTSIGGAGIGVFSGVFGDVTLNRAEVEPLSFSSLCTLSLRDVDKVAGAPSGVFGEGDAFGGRLV